MDAAVGEITQLNERTFEAEEREPADAWQAFLSRVLADDFVLRRSRPEVSNETKEQMIERIEAPDYRIVNRKVYDVRVWTSESLGVVSSVVELPDKSGEIQTYQNVKVFRSSRAGEWLCVYWQVSGMPRPVSQRS
jgi:hypothetical protein